MSLLLNKLLQQQFILEQQLRATEQSIKFRETIFLQKINIANLIIRGQQQSEQQQNIQNMSILFMNNQPHYNPKNPKQKQKQRISVFQKDFIFTNSSIKSLQSDQINRIEDGNLSPAQQPKFKANKWNTKKSNKNRNRNRKKTKSIRKMYLKNNSYKNNKTKPINNTILKNKKGNEAKKIIVKKGNLKNKNKAQFKK